MKKTMLIFLIAVLIWSLSAFDSVFAQERIKIGVSIWGYTDSLGGSVYKMLSYAAEALDCDVEFVAQNFNTDEVIASVENLCASGCDGIIVCNSSDGQMPALIKTCNENQVYLAQFFRDISTQKIAEFVAGSRYFVGRTVEDEYLTGYNMGTIMYEKGCKNVAIINYNHGDLTAETRYKGYINAFKEHGVNLLAEQWEILTAEKSASAVENFIAAYPELDGVAVVGGGGENQYGAINAIAKCGKTGEIVVVSTDFTDSLYQDMKAGKISAMSGGHWCDPLFSFLMVYNAINGAYDPADFPLKIVDNMIYVKSAEDAFKYNKWFKGDILPYTAKEIQEMAISFNPEATIADLQNAASSLSIEDVMKRHAGMLK